MFYIDRYYFLLVVPALLIASLAQVQVKSTFGKFSKMRTLNGITGETAARRILQSYGIYNVNIVPIPGKLTDHFDPRENTVRLSQEVFYGSTVAAVGVAAHEIGHVIQHNVDYAPLKLREMLIPVTNIGSAISMPMILLGIIMGAAPLVDLGIICFSMMALFQLVTLPVEFNASRRALKIIEADGILQTEEENEGAKRVLTAAALTYVAALLVSVMQVLRLVLLYHRDDD